MKPIKSKSGKVYDLAWILSNCIERDSCWVWNRSSSNGYGHFVVTRSGRSSKSYRVHRYVFSLVYGKPATENVVRHTCHNRLCCNPMHLEQGTHRDNWCDSEQIHRFIAQVRKLRKLRAHNASLSDSKVRSYRKQYGNGSMTVSAISKETGLSLVTVIAFLTGKTYRRDIRYVDTCIRRRASKTKGSSLKKEVDTKTIRSIRKYRNKGLSDYSIANLIPLSRAKIQRTRVEYCIP